MNDTASQDPTAASEPLVADLDPLPNVVWLLPVFGALTSWATITAQSDPDTGFLAWARFLTSDGFFPTHLLGGAVGLALGAVGIATAAHRTGPTRHTVTNQTGDINMATTSTFQVAGMSCGHCVGSVRSEVSAIDGVTDVAVDLATGQLTVTADTPLDADTVRAAVEAAGYEVVT